MRNRLAWSRLAALALLACMVMCVVSTHAWGTAEDAQSIVKRDKAEEIQFWERQVSALRQGEMMKALNKLYKAQSALEVARRKEGFFYTRPEDKATIRLLDEDYRRTLIEVESVKAKEAQMLARLKPLYGVVSLHFAQEQKNTISESIKTVQSMSYDNAWYSSLFSFGEAESFSDVIVSFLGNWLIGFLMLYPFAVLYYALWAAPWSVYAYTSGIADVVPATVAYLVCVLIMALPLIILVLTGYILIRYYRPQLQAAARRANARRHYD